MSEHHFGLGRGKVSARLAKRVDRIADRLGATFTYGVFPGDGARYWFSCQNLGEPFNGATAGEVLTAIKEAGIVLPGDVQPEGD